MALIKFKDSNGVWQTITSAQGEQGIQGNGIASINRTSGDGSPGSTDVYTITYTDTTSDTISVYNGADAPSLAGVKQYIIKWDKVNSQCTRMGDASAITTTTTNFKHSGSINGSYSNPFDDIYPWKYRKLVKVNRAAYAALTAGTPITNAITKWEGEPGFTLDGTGDFDGVYTPAFWARQWEDETYVYVGVADGPVPGWQFFEATIGGRYFGSMDGSSKITSIANSIPLRNTRLDTMHTNVNSQKLTLDDIYTWCADSILLCVEYATLNTQTAVGNGCDGLYRQDESEKVGENASIGSTLVKLPNAFVAACVPGAVIGFGTSLGGEQTGVSRFISSADLDSEDPLFSTHKGVTIPALTFNVTTSTLVCVHGCFNAPDIGIGSKSGYLGTVSKCNAYYRGRVAHGNYWRYILGAYRQTGTGAIWIASSRTQADSYDGLDTGVHVNTGYVLPVDSNYISTLHRYNTLPLAPFTATVAAGGSVNPVGDYTYVPSLATGNTVLQAGGNAGNGVDAGPFCGHWNWTASTAAWRSGVLPFLKTP